MKYGKIEVLSGIGYFGLNMKEDNPYYPHILKNSNSYQINTGTQENPEWQYAIQCVRVWNINKEAKTATLQLRLNLTMMFPQIKVEATDSNPTGVVYARVIKSVKFTERDEMLDDGNCTMSGISFSDVENFYNNQVLLESALKAGVPIVSKGNKVEFAYYPNSGEFRGISTEAAEQFGLAKKGYKAELGTSLNLNFVTNGYMVFYLAKCFNPKTQRQFVGILDKTPSEQDTYEGGYGFHVNGLHKANARGNGGNTATQMGLKIEPVKTKAKEEDKFNFEFKAPATNVESNGHVEKEKVLDTGLF